jgi:hypothetical protein
MKASKKTKYEYMAVHLPRPTKKRLRMIAAEMELPLGRAAERLMEKGLAELELELERERQKPPAQAEAQV